MKGSPPHKTYGRDQAMRIPRIETDHFFFRYRDRDSGPYEHLHVKCGDLRIQISCSPTGRSQQVWINNSRVYP